MQFGAVALTEALGAVLAHSVLVHSVQAGEVRLKKGLVLDASHLEALRNAGIDRVTVARLGPDDVDENTAANRIARALLGDDPDACGLRASTADTGRVNLYARIPGILRLDRAAIERLNRVDPMITLATVREWQRMGPGGMVATIKIIAYAVPEAALNQAETGARGALSMAPAVRTSATLIQTRTAQDPGDKGTRAIRRRLEALGVTLTENRTVPHEETALAQAITAAAGEVILILTASATSDENDVAPAALRRAGGVMHRFGMPVDPGNLLFIGQLGDRPVIGLPGCARSPALNGADWVLERILCGVPVSADDIAAMGIGGLLKEIASRPRPREP